MELITKQKKIDILEHAFAANAGAYYNINLTKNLVPGHMYQVINEQKYNINEQMGFSENARFSEIVTYWGNKLSKDQREAYFKFLDIPSLLKRFKNGESHVYHKYWTKSAIFEPMLAEQHIVMYKDEETEDILAITYVLDLTQEYKEEQYKRELEEKQKKLEDTLQKLQEAEKYREMQIAQTAVDEVLENITMLDTVSSEEELNKIMPCLLASLGKYSMADRSYVFSWTSEERKILYMTHEWCAKGVEPTIDKMQDLKIRDLPNWEPRLNAGEAIVSMDWNAEKQKTPEEFEIFDGQDIHALIVIPIFSNNKLNGYIGFDNPEQKKTALSVRLLTAVGGHIGGLKENLHMMAELEEKQLSLKNNVEELKKEKAILDALSIDYTSTYYCDLEEDKITVLKQGNYTNAIIAEETLTEGLQSYSFRIKYYYDAFVVKESAPDFLEKLSADYLKRYLQENDRLAYRFQAIPNRAGQQYFEVQVVRLTGQEGFKTVMGYRYVDDIVEEQEKQRVQLETALTEATLNSEIIDSISKIYWLIYRMDLVSGIYEEISSGQEMHRLTGKRGTIKDVFAHVRETIVCEEHQDLMKKFLDTTTLSQRLRKTETISTEYRAANGSWHLGRFIVKKRDEQGKVTNVLYVVRQIDHQKQMELEYKERLLETAQEAKRANIAKTDFLRRMSHDIRTPINGIQGMVNIAEHYPQDDQKQKECRDKVKEAAGYLLDLVNSVLDMNKLESGVVVLENQPFDLRNLLQESNNIVKMGAEVEGLKVVFKCDLIQHTHLLGSAVHLKQILQNISGNAVKYNKEGGSITLSCEEIDYKDDVATYRFVCQDTGIGMSEKFIPHVFEPFAQEEQSARTAYMGTGLGLAIVKQLVEMMGGQIEMTSKLNVGTTFTIVLPFKIDKSYEDEEMGKAIVSDEILKGKKVLLVEDNELNMEVAEFFLKGMGMIVTKAGDGMEALKCYKASKEGYFDLILMDIMMPVMNGLEATKQIRALSRKDAKEIPIIAMTANAFNEDKEQTREAGMNEHIAKPIDVKKVEEVLVSVLR